jgi:hypothetical protein
VEIAVAAGCLCWPARPCGKIGERKTHNRGGQPLPLESLFRSSCSFHFGVRHFLFFDRARRGAPAHHYNGHAMRDFAFRPVLKAYVGAGQSDCCRESSIRMNRRGGSDDFVSLSSEIRLLSP